MSKREIIIVFAALVAIMYAVYSLFIASSSKQITNDTTMKKAEAVRSIANFSAILDKDALTKTDIYIITRSEAEWEKDPFLKTELAKELKIPKQPVPLEEKISFTYSGYIEMGDKRMAIINDVEYETDDELELTGYIVERIDPLEVIISDIERQRKITVPIEPEAL